MKKIIITDLDGTLLNKDKNIAADTKKAIETAIKHGKMFAIASGRAADECLVVIKALGFKSYKNVFIIANNGALIYDVEHSKVIYKKFLTPKIANGVFDYMKKNSLKAKDKMGGHIHCLDPKTSQLTKDMRANLNLPQTFY
jgi:hydroxymethylpyrimidine pyrophosphatase-like HAD family hydrolase